MEEATAQLMKVTLEADGQDEEGVGVPLSPSTTYPQ